MQEAVCYKKSAAKKIVRIGKFFVSSVLFYSGCILLFNRIRTLLGHGRIQILAYHNISHTFPPYLGLSKNPVLFENEIRFLCDHYEIISLSKAIEQISKNQKIDKDKIVITFDDNYKEYYSIVRPIKEKYGFDMTIFVAVDPLEQQLPLFVHGLVYAVNNTKKSTLDLREFVGKSFWMATQEEKHRTVWEINEWSKGLTRQERYELLKKLFQKAALDIKEMKKFLLTWDELAEIVKGGISVGSHTLSHPFLTAVPRREAMYEIEQSKKILEDKLGTPVTAIAYPFGNIQSCDSLIKDYVKNAGYAAGCGMQGGYRQSDLYFLSRTNMDPGKSAIVDDRFFKPLFALELSGLADIVFFRRLKQSLSARLYSTRASSHILKAGRNKISITFIIDQLVTFGGTEKHLLQLASRLDRQRFSCHVIAFMASQDVMNKFRTYGVSIESLDLRKIYGWSAIRKFFYLLSRLRVLKPDIVQTFHFMSDTYGVFASRVYNIPVVISSRRDMGELKKIRQIFLNKLINPFIHGFISVCDRVAEEVSKVEAVPRHKISTIYNGVELARYDSGPEAKEKARKKLGIENHAFVVGNVCLLRPEKDVFMFLKALSALNKEIHDLTILIVGDGDTRDELEACARKSGIFDKTIFTGYVNDIRPYVQAMDIACLTPKENEGLSNVILEEMAMGKPVIATDCGGNAELVLDGVTGFVISPGDTEALSRAVVKLYRDPDRREIMGKQARRRAEQYFTIEQMIDVHEKFYQFCLREHFFKKEWN